VLPCAKQITPITCHDKVIDVKSLNSLTRHVEFFTVKERVTEGEQSFRAIARIVRERESNKTSSRVTRVLMDPGAEINLLRKELLDNILGRDSKLKVHAREQCDVVLMNNGKEIANVKEAAYLSFALDGKGGEQHEYHEWFYLWENMDEEMILGSLFCKEQSFTNFHKRLQPWCESLSNTRIKRTRGIDAVYAVSSIPPVNECDKAACEHGEVQLLPSPLTNKELRVRDRLINLRKK
jgi:hypothetical protein